MHQWFYVKPGIVGDEQIGPLTEQDFLALVQSGGIGPKSLICSPSRTNGNWMAVEGHAKLLEIWRAGQSQRELAKSQQAAQRQAEAAAKQQAQQQVRQAEQAAVAQQRSHRDQELAAISDCANATALEKILGWVGGLLTAGERVVYIAVQDKPMTISPDAVVATDKRLIFFSPKLLGRFDFKDFLWRELGNAHLSQGMIGSTFSASHVQTGQKLSMDYLNKQAAQRLYRLCQEHEEQAVELRRQREMEERRAGAMSIQVGMPAAPTPSTNGDLVQRMATLKTMLDQGLISPAEFEQRKQQILSQV